MEPELRDLLTRLSLALGAPQSDENSDDLIEVFGEVEVKRTEVSRQLIEWLESEAD